MTHKEFAHMKCNEKEQNEKEIKEFIVSYINTHVYAPTPSEIAEETGLHVHTVRNKLKELLKTGFIESEIDEPEGRAHRIARTKVVRIKQSFPYRIKQ